MVSAKVLSSYIRIGIAGALFGVIYLNTSHFFNGYGGAIGSAASISVLAVISLPYLIPPKTKISKPPTEA